MLKRYISVIDDEVEEHTSSRNIDFNDHSVNSNDNLSEDDNVFRERKE